MPKILIIKPSSLGDVATTMPMLMDLHAALPDSQIDWLISPAFTALLQNHPAIHALIPFDRKTLGHWYTPRGLTTLRTLKHNLQSAKYDIVIDAQGLLRSGIMTRLTKAPIRIGFAHAREGAARAYTHKVTLPNSAQKMLAVDRMRSLLTPLNITPGTSPLAHIQIDPEALTHIDTLLGPIAPPTILIPGARWDTKRWSLEGSTEIARRILSTSTTLILAGSPNEKPLCDQIENALKSTMNNPQSTISSPDSRFPVPDTRGLLNLAGQTTLPQLIALLSRSRLVIGNDSGPLHVAVALGIPIVAAYGPTDPAFVGPAGQLQNVVRFAVPCFPCRNKTCDHHSCMRGITVEMMWEKTQGTRSDRVKSQAV